MNCNKFLTYGKLGRIYGAIIIKDDCQKVYFLTVGLTAVIILDISINIKLQQYISTY